MATVNISAIDILQARINQIDGVLSMLASAGDGDGFESLTHQTVMRSIWAAQDLLDQAGAAASSLRFGV